MLQFSWGWVIFSHNLTGLSVLEQDLGSFHYWRLQKEKLVEILLTIFVDNDIEMNLEELFPETAVGCTAS